MEPHKMQIARQQAAVTPGFVPGEARLNKAGRCMAPINIGYDQMNEQPLKKGLRVFKLEHINMDVPCRRCERCRETKRRMWTARALYEVSNSTRTWFGTLTLRPAAHNYFRTKSQKRDLERGAFHDQTAEQIFKSEDREISEEITKYLKRVRAESGARLRVLLVSEEHESGLPHYHLLVHEKGVTPIKYDTLTDQWKFGFTKWKLVHDGREATYVCKYISKSTMTRVRASLRYGIPENSADEVVNVIAAHPRDGTKDASASEGTGSSKRGPKSLDFGDATARHTGRRE